MSVKRRENKKELVKQLYIKGDYSQAQVSELTGVTEGTVNRWSKEGEWSKLKASKIISKQDSLQRLYEQINELHGAIKSRPEGKRYANSKEADILVKLTSAIEKLEAEMPLNVVITVFLAYGKWLEEKNGFEAHKAFILQADEFVQEHPTMKANKEKE